jgi:hypothetical protein
MTYRQIMPLSGLGQDTPMGPAPDASWWPLRAPLAAHMYQLPEPNQGAYMEQAHSDVQWLLINSDDVLGNIAKALSYAGVTDGIVQPRVWRNNFVGEGGGRLGENEPFLLGLRAMWVRMVGRLNEEWPGARNEYNFGPNHDAEQSLRISKNFYNLIRLGNLPIWRVSYQGYVRIHTFDQFWASRIRGKLVRWGYVASQDPPTVGLMSGVRQWFNDAQAAGIDVGTWPHWDLGDRSTDGSEVLVHEKLLFNIIFGVGPREQLLGGQTREMLKGADIRPAIMGSLTNLSGKYGAQKPVAIKITKSLLNLVLPK